MYIHIGASGSCCVCACLCALQLLWDNCQAAQNRVLIYDLFVLWTLSRVYKCERVSNSLYYCVVALVQGHDLYNHIHACGKPQGYKQGYIVLL